MPLNTEVPCALRFVVPGVVSGAVCFAFSRLMIEPQISAAVDYEGAREHTEAQLAGDGHEHGHELFSRSVQENFGAAVGIIALAVAMGVLFGVAYTVIRGMLDRRGINIGPTTLALLLSAGMFVAVAWAPGLKYPPNPPTVGLDETIAARSSAFLTITVVSVVGASVAVAAGLAWARRWGSWPAAAAAVGGYGVVMTIGFLLMPSFHEVPGPITGPAGLLLDGFPAEVLAEFRTFSVLNQALMWATIGLTWACLSALPRAARAATSSTRQFAI